MQVRHSLLMAGLGMLAGLSLGVSSAPAAQILWSTGFETSDTVGVPDNASVETTEVHSGSQSAKATGNTSHHWVAPFNTTAIALPALGPGEAITSATFTFWVKPISPATNAGLTYQVVLQPVDGSSTSTANVVGYGNSTSAEQWQQATADVTTDLIAAYTAGAVSIPHLYVQGTSTGFASFDNYYLDDVSFQMETTVIPEPASLSLLGLGGLALLARRRRA